MIKIPSKTLRWFGLNNQEKYDDFFNNLNKRRAVQGLRPLKFAPFTSYRNIYRAEYLKRKYEAPKEPRNKDLFPHTILTYLMSDNIKPEHL